MKAIAYQENLPIEDLKSLQDIELNTPKACARDILVEVKAISVNPVDIKVRKRAKPSEGEWKILGFDASGIVKEVGSDVTLFKVGDKVFYAGDLTRTGTNAQLHLVDERIVGRMPKSLSFAQSAALPLTSITAWEMLFDRLLVDKKTKGKSILVIGAAGGVGSIMVQLIKQLTNLDLIATASREETKQWLKDLGVDHVINHKNKLSDEFKKYNLPEVDYVVCLNNTDEHLFEIVKVIKAQGRFGLTDDPSEFSIMPFKMKAVSIHWEFMFTRSMFKTEDMQAQHDLLNEVSNLVDKGILKSTVAKNFGAINAKNLRKAHAYLESGKSKGKIVLEGF